MQFIVSISFVSMHDQVFVCSHFASLSFLSVRTMACSLCLAGIAEAMVHAATCVFVECIEMPLGGSGAQWPTTFVQYAPNLCKAR